MSPIIEVNQVSFTYPSPPVEALREISFSVDTGRFMAVMGPNGSGKTTLVKLLLGSLRPHGGTVRVLGHDPVAGGQQVQRVIGYVPQHEVVNDQVPVRVRDVVNMAAACRYGTGLNRREVHRRVEQALGMVELAPQADRPFSALSGGQKQRALIARALVVDPLILIADEPFAGVDAVSQQSIITLLQRLRDEHGVTVLAVLHNVNPLVHFLDQVLLLNQRQVACGTPEEVLTGALLREAYGRAVPVLVCDEGFPHPITEAPHGE
jgi:ABC-type Mn2+/Zn2+ transport system ATPase subunit